MPFHIMKMTGLDLNGRICTLLLSIILYFLNQNLFGMVCMYIENFVILSK